jgi:hypothetical protein
VADRAVVAVVDSRVLIVAVVAVVLVELGQMQPQV